MGSLQNMVDLRLNNWTVGRKPFVERGPFPASWLRKRLGPPYASVRRSGGSVHDLGGAGEVNPIRVEAFAEDGPIAYKFSDPDIVRADKVRCLGRMRLPKELTTSAAVKTQTDVEPPADGHSAERAGSEPASVNHRFETRATNYWRCSPNQGPTLARVRPIFSRLGRIRTEIRPKSPSIWSTLSQFWPTSSIWPNLGRILTISSANRAEFDRACPSCGSGEQTKRRGQVGRAIAAVQALHAEERRAQVMVRRSRLCRCSARRSRPRRKARTVGAECGRGWCLPVGPQGPPTALALVAAQTPAPQAEAAERTSPRRKTSVGFAPSFRSSPDLARLRRLASSCFREIARNSFRNS